jgi:hypothetical protein
MTHYRSAQRISRRRFLGGAAAATTVGLGMAYGLDQRLRTAPYATASGFAAPNNSLEAPAGILLITTPDTRPNFSAYLHEILRTEGFLGVRALPLERLNRAALEGVSVVVLGAGALSANQASLVSNYVADGGGLIGLRPDPILADLFGVRFLGGDVPGADLRIDPTQPAVSGITPEPLQVHTAYARLAGAGAQVLATSANGDPLVTRHRHGRGATVLWAFDPARNIALIRQGNPAYANLERDAMPGVRASDLFRDWIDLERIGIPQADEQQRLLSVLVEHLATSGPPLPRLWYFPGGAPGMLVATGDAHGSRVSHIERLLGAVEQYGGSASIYYTPPEARAVEQVLRRSRWKLSRLPVIGGRLGGTDPLPSPQQVAEWRARGHEFGMHPYVEEGLAAGYNAYWNEFIKYGYGPLPPTVRTHRILWHGWVENARVQAQYGLRMNLDHYHSGPAVQRADGGWTRGYLSGTGLPMRFVSAEGELLSVYQQPTHLVDEHLMDVFSTGFEVGLEGEAAAAETIAQIAESVQRYPAALGLQCHIDPFLLGGAKAERVGYWLDATLAYSAAQGIPMRSAEHWLHFVEARTAVQPIGQHWDAVQHTLTLDVEAPAAATDALMLMLPLRHGNTDLRTIRNAADPTIERTLTLAGRNYAAVALRAGRQTIHAEYGG